MEELFKQTIVLRSGMLYNITISALIFVVCLYCALSIILKTRRTPQNRSFADFLLLLGLYFFIHGLANLFAWYGLTSFYKNLDIFLRLAIVLQVVPLAFCLFSSISEKESSVFIPTFLLGILSLVFFMVSLFDRGSIAYSYWGLHFSLGVWSAGAYLVFVLFPIAGTYAYLMILKIKKSENILIPLSVFIYILLETTQHLTATSDWSILLYRLIYLLVASAGYLYFIDEEIKSQEFIPVGALAPSKPKLRFPFFTKLLFLLILISVIPIVISSFLMLFTFREVIDLYIYKPLFWGMKASREQFMTALTNAQFQTFFLMSITVILVIIAAAIISFSIAQSLRRIGKGMERISSGDFSFRILQESNDEIGDLVVYFNNMSAEIKRARDILENWNQQLDAEVKKKTRQLKEAYEQLISLDKLKTEFVSMVSHELRTPLTNIENFVSLFADGILGPVTEEQTKSLKTISTANHKELALVNRLLNFSDMESGKFFITKEPQEMNKIIQSVLDNLSEKIKEKGVKVTLKLDAQNDRFAGDKEKISFAVQDILDNAVKFSPESPRITIETKNREEQLEINISDNGIGLPVDKLENIFEKFYQVDSSWTRNFGGTGLGLAVAKDIIQSHEGTIRAESEGEGRGTTIKISLPLILA